MRVEYSVTRVLPHTPEVIWEAWTDADKLAAWYGPMGMQSPRESVKSDPQVGGFWSATVHVPFDGSNHHFFGRYLELEPEALLRYSMFYATDEDLADALREQGKSATITVRIEPTTDGTRVTFEQQGSDLGDEEAVQAQAGMESYFDSLEQFLKS
jgi:uncharacterized protein YndB with AHSA1/START domain